MYVVVYSDWLVNSIKSVNRMEYGVPIAADLPVGLSGWGLSDSKSRGILATGVVQLLDPVGQKSWGKKKSSSLQRMRFDSR